MKKRNKRKKCNVRLCDLGNVWTRIKRIREVQGFSSTSVKLVLKVVALDPEKVSLLLIYSCSPYLLLIIYLFFIILSGNSQRAR